MAVDQLSVRVREFSTYLDGLLARLDQGGGWCAVFWERDPDGMRACLEGREVPPWDVVEALLHDLAAAYGPAVAAPETERARALHAAALAAYDARPGGRAALGDRLQEMLREQLYTAERQSELGRLLASATTRQEADTVRLDLAWARDDHERASARCVELRARMAESDRQGPVGRTDRPTPREPGGRGPMSPGRSPGGTYDGFAAGRPGYGAAAPRSAPAHGAAAPEPAPAHGAAAPEPAPAYGSPFPEPAPGYDVAAPEPAPGRRPSAQRPEPSPAYGASAPEPALADGRSAPAPAPAEGSWISRPAPVDGLFVPEPAPVDSSFVPEPAPADDAHASVSMAVADHTHAPADGIPVPGTRESAPAVGQPSAAASRASREPAPAAPVPAPAKQRKRRRGSARFAGMVEEGAASVVVPPDAAPPRAEGPAASGRTPRGARFARVAEAVRRPEPKPAAGSPDAVAARETAETVGRLVRLRAEGHSGEAHALLVEIAHWPAARFPLLADELQRAALGADWATLLWEAASLPAGQVVAAADALAGAGRAGDGERILRQGVARPAAEIGEAVLALAGAGARREVRALLDAYVRVRTPDEAARCVGPEPRTLVPLLLEAARGVSDERHWDVVHALRVAGFTV
ncbi:hypothetical protein [Streptomyces adustus]|uniref:hypothetical protein n=1 Tax=Streptomyces adustus TaxID=1609272 RepID=UPI0037138FEC